MKGTTLVSFLGTGDYQPVLYRWRDKELTTRYFARAAADFFGVEHAIILATAEARERHGKELCQAMAELPGVKVEFRIIPPGRTADELWDVFDSLLQALQAGEPVFLDITHGYRSLPFFSAAAIAWLRASGGLPSEFHVLYGAFDARDDQGAVPVWELTAFVELIQWAHGISVFTTTGLADPLLEIFRTQDSRNRRALALMGANRFPNTTLLASALERFADDFQTLRIAAMVRGSPLGKEYKDSSAARLVHTVEACSEDIRRFLPALAPLLDRIAAFARGIESPTLHGEAGGRAMRALARRYLELRRHVEAAVVVREAWVSRHADSPVQTEPGLPQFDPAARRAAERHWASTCKSAQAVAEIRNDMEHGGFRLRPLPAKTLRRQVKRLVEELDRTADNKPVPRPCKPAQAWLVSRHPGAREWIQRRGIRVDHVVAHLDSGQIQPGDIVIGTLPVHVVADVCKRGARYFHLLIDLPAERRGQELSADDLDALGAHLEPFCAYADHRSIP